MAWEQRLSLVLLSVRPVLAPEQAGFAEDAGLALNGSDGFQPFAEMAFAAAARLRLIAERLAA